MKIACFKGRLKLKYLGTIIKISGNEVLVARR